MGWFVKKPHFSTSFFLFRFVVVAVIVLYAATGPTTSARLSEPCGNPAVSGTTSEEAIVGVPMSTIWLYYAGSTKACYRGPHIGGACAA